jgi:hypothetical protein
MRALSISGIPVAARSGRPPSFPQSHRRDHLDPVGGLGLFPFAPAGIADAEDLEVVKGGPELAPLADFQRSLLELRVEKLDDTAAGGADEMVVMGVAADVLVVVVVFAEVDATDQSGFHEEFEAAVDGGARDLDALLLHLEEELVGLEVVMGGKDLANEGGALGGELEALVLEEGVEGGDGGFRAGHGKFSGGARMMADMLGGDRARP